MKKQIACGRASAPEAGFALIMVMGIGLVLVLLMATAVTLSVSNLQKARGDQDWSAADAAAYAGVADYTAKLANDNVYYRYGNPAARFSPLNTVTPPPTPNPAFALGVDEASWAVVPGGLATAKYRYEVDNSAYVSSGIVRLRVTGKVGSALRSILVSVKQRGFVDYLYFTRYELIDPIQSNAACVPSYAWQVPHSAKCMEVTFGSADTLDGPVHSNDTIRVCGAKFLQGLSSSSQVYPYYISPSGCALPNFAAGSDNQPVTRVPIDLPSTNSQLKQEVRVDLAKVPSPGCLYTGPTSIVFNGNKTMTIKSPFTRATNLAADFSGTLNIGSAGATCGLIGAAHNSLGNVGGATIPVIDSNLIYIQDVPSASSADPNYWAHGGYPSSFTCNNASSVAGWKFGSLAYPLAAEKTPAATPAHYGCRRGDVYVSGNLQGRLTLAAENYVYVTGDIIYSNSSANGDLLGLVGNNSVWVWNPQSSDGTALLPSNRHIAAAIVSVNHSFQVQNFSTGAVRGTLTIFGAIAQQFRGTTGTATASAMVTGFSKAYVYDKRLKHQVPPKFLSPVAATFSTTQLVEVSPPFAVDGSYR